MAADLTILGYDQFGNAFTSRPAQTNNNLMQPNFDIKQDWSTINTPMLFNGAITNAKLASASIGTANIGTLSFNQISGGTATLGGTNNGNGLLLLKNSSGVQILKADQTGLLITGGSVVIVGQTMWFGTLDPNCAIYYSNPGTALRIDALSSDILLETDSAKQISLYAGDGGTIRLVIGTATNLIVKSGSGGTKTVMTLNGQTGDLRIAGTLGTGLSL